MEARKVPARTQQRFVDQVETVSHADDKHVVERIHTVHLRQQLIDHLVAGARVVRGRPACPDTAVSQAGVRFVPRDSNAFTKW